NHFLKIQYLILNNNKPEKRLFHYLKSLAYVLRMFVVLQTMFEYHSTYIRHILKFDNEQSICLDVHQFALCTLATIHHSYFQKELDFVPTFLYPLIKPLVNSILVRLFSILNT